MYKYLFFDLDGTLTDSQEGITKSVSYALISLGVEDIPQETKLKFIGPPLKDSFPKYCGFDEEMTAKAIKLYRERYSTVGKFENRPYEGIPELLKELKDDNRMLIIASSKPTEFVEDILKKFDIREYFDLISAAELSGANSEKEDVIRKALKELNFDFKEDGVSVDTKDDKSEKIDLSEAVMIGDRHYDIIGANHFGMDSIGVNYGFAQDKNELKDAGATHVVESVKELRDLLFS